MNGGPERSEAEMKTALLFSIVEHEMLMDKPDMKICLPEPLIQWIEQHGIAKKHLKSWNVLKKILFHLIF